jgi:hypothetical protein
MRTLAAGQDVVAASCRTPHGLQGPFMYLTRSETTSVRSFAQNHVRYQSAYPLQFVQTLGVEPIVDRRNPGMHSQDGLH